MTTGKPVGLLDILGELGLAGVTYPGLIRSITEVDPSQPAARFGDERVTYGELAARIGAAATHLRSRGVASGDRVAVMLPNSIDTLVIHLAIQALGAVGALVNTSLLGEPLRSVLDHAAPTCVIAAPDVAGRVIEVGPGRTILVTNDAEIRAALRGNADVLPFLDERTGSPLDPAFINYTSGTTGLPKGVVLKQVFSAGALVLARRLDLKPREERVYLATPTYHALGLAMSSMALRLAAELVIAPRFSATRYWDDVRDTECTFAYHVGTMAQVLYNQPPSHRDGDHHLRAFIGGGMPADIWVDFARRFKVTVIESYSASDGVGAITNWSDGPVGSFGRPDPEIEARVVDGDDVEVGADVTGELQLRPAGGGLGGHAVQYDGDAEATEEKNRGGWVRTGDLVRRDADGWLFFVDRMKDVIRRRGVNIAPAEIERVILTHPKVRECAALAVPSELGEDEIKLIVVAKDLGPEEITRFAEASLPQPMRPRYFEVVDALPKTITERVQRYKLKASWRTAATWDLTRGTPVGR